MGIMKSMGMGCYALSGMAYTAREVSYFESYWARQSISVRKTASVVLADASSLVTAVLSNSLSGTAPLKRFNEVKNIRLK